MKPIPVCCIRPAILIGFLAIAASIFPDPLVYDRTAIQSGEWWRLLSGHLVHFSHWHLVANLAVVIPSAWILAAEGEVRLIRTWLAAALLMGIGLYYVDPRLEVYGGLSGMACLMLVWVSAYWLAFPGLRAFAAALFAITCLKVFYWDFTFAGRTYLPDGVALVQASHILGVYAGTVPGIFYYLKARKRHASDPSGWQA